MCGILGILDDSFGDNAALLRALRTMGLWQHHRGPDDWGDWLGDGVALGHNRLSILDLEAGHQPQASPDGRVQVVFNGEIYNYRALWDELAAKGYRFRTDHSDTEVIVHGYCEWGTDVFRRLDGMFAVGIWDQRRGELVLARDRPGIKPLFYARTGGGSNGGTNGGGANGGTIRPARNGGGPRGVVFASEPKAILASGLVRAEMDPASLAEYFMYRAARHPRSSFRGIEKLPPATWMAFDRQGGVRGATYWAPDPWTHPPRRFANRRAAEEAAAETIERAVVSHCISDVPVGIFLSGGVDSSLVAGLVSKHLKLDAFTVGTDSSLDEVPFARQVARHFGIPLYDVRVTPDDFLRRFDDWVYYNDDPVSDPSALALLVLAEFARDRGMKVMLAGEGADELFGGYNAYYRYAAMEMLAGLPLGGHVGRWLGRRMEGRSGDYLRMLPRMKFLGTGHLTSAATRRSLLDRDLARDFERRLAADPCASQHAKEADRAVGPMRRAMIFDQQVRLPDDILARTDRATMAVSLETRVPFLDHRVIELANALPDRWCVSLPRGPKSGKRILKEMLARILPRHLVYRPKRGFDLPIAQWLSGPFEPVVREYLNGRAIAGLNYEYLRQTYDAHRQGQTAHAAMIWAWLVLENWHRLWIRGEATPKRPKYVTNAAAYEQLIAAQ